VGEGMKYWWVVLIVASVAGLEFFHEFGSGDAPGAAVCLAPDSQQQAMRDILVQHLQSHR